jgi:hypothetical protein
MNTSIVFLKKKTPHNDETRGLFLCGAFQAYLTTRASTLLSPTVDVPGSIIVRLVDFHDDFDLLGRIVLIDPVNDVKDILTLPFLEAKLGSSRVAPGRPVL